jgi:hypothetical protein
MMEDGGLANGLDAESQALYDRSVVVRGESAVRANIPPRKYATNCALRNIAMNRPSTTEESARYRDLHPEYIMVLARKFIDTIIRFEQELQEDEGQTKKAHEPIESATKESSSPDKTPSHDATVLANLNSASGVHQRSPPPSVSAPDVGALQSHTGLSLCLAEADITGGDTEPEDSSSEDDAPNSTMTKHETPASSTSSALFSTNGEPENKAPILRAGPSISMAEDESNDRKDIEVRDIARRCERES